MAPYVPYARADAMDIEDLVRVVRRSRQLMDPVVGSIRVPAKNQPTILGRQSSVEDYWFAFDGTRGLVLWEHHDGEGSDEISVGRVVAEILAAVAASVADEAGQMEHASMGLMTLLIAEGEDDAAPVVRRLADHRTEFAVPGLTDDASEAASRLFFDVRNLAESFYSMENLRWATARAMNICDSALDFALYWVRRDADRRAGAWWRRVRGLMTDIGWRRQVRSAIADALLALSTVRLLSEKFAEVRTHLEDRSDNPALAAFVPPYTDAPATMAVLDLSARGDLVEFLAAVLDNRALAQAAAWGAIAGAATGVVGGSLIS